MLGTTPLRTVAALALVPWVLAVAALAHVLLAGPVEPPGLVLDRLTAVLVVLITGVAAVIAVFSTRYLQDDPHLGRFLGLLALTTAGTVVFAAAASLVVLVAGWLVAGAGFCGLLAHRRDVAGARTALRRTVAAFAVGDAALLAAAGLALVAVGNLDLREPAAAAAALADAGVAAPIGVLLVVAALARCAQLPLHRWLPATVAAPTPVSALLHAGLVNAGGILLVRLGPVAGLADAAGYLLFAAGAATAAYAGAAMLTRPDVKGALAHSTMAQMGFMLVQVALGAVAAAVVHLVGHAMYKAALFLGSGSAVAAARRHAAAAPRASVAPAVRLAAALGLPLAALAGAIALAGGIEAVGGAGTAVVLAFAWASGAQAVDGWLRSGPPAALAVAALASVVAAAAYVGLLAGAKAFLEPSLPAAVGVDPWLGAALVPAIVAVTVARMLPARGAAGRGVRLRLARGRRRGRPPRAAGAPPAAPARRDSSARPDGRGGLVTAPDRRGEARAALRAQIAEAARIVSPVWPLGSFVAVNPLGGLVDRPFEEAVAVARPLLGIRGLPAPSELRRALDEGRASIADVRAAVARRHPELGEDDVGALAARTVAADDAAVAPGPRTVAERCDAALGTAVAATTDEETAKWCAAFADEDAGRWRMPGRERGFYTAWRDLAGRGPALRRLARPGVRQRLAALPDAPDDAVLHALDLLGVHAAARAGELRGQLARLPGWASVAAWHEDQAIHGLDLVQLLAVRLVYDLELLAGATGQEVGTGVQPCAAGASPPDPAGEGPAEAGGGSEPGAIALAALEGAYADRLLAGLDGVAPAAPGARPAAQAVFCIDARSEGLRRHLEGQGPYETLGFAGFFAVAMSYRALGSRRADAQAPVLLDPRHAVAEVAAGPGAERFLGGRGALAGVDHAVGRAKEGVVSPFALAEVGGWVAGPLAAARTLAAGAHARVRDRLHAAAAPPPLTQLDVDAAIGPDEQLAIAHAALTMMGLTSGFAPLVLLCGHGSSSENNPYAASLDCGACGGHEGAPNARAAAMILNGPHVRAGLAGLGVEIPEDTWFVAGRHDTTTDRVDVLDRHLVPASHAGELVRLERDLHAAGERNAADRARALPGSGARPGSDDGRRRSADWAQVRPEWGLARNAAFIVGPRAMTAGLDLGRRTFLHSYDHRVDPDGAALETILTAPLVVAQWINAQYFFSTTDPDVLGAGDKVVHNVVAGVGVLQGAGGDLRLGLPRQACFAGDRPYHEPLRLLAVVQAPLERIEELVARNTILRHFFDGGWVGLAARAEPGDPWQRWGPGGWEPRRSASAPTAGARA
jgi:uncharacterized protein YbcC (UPF0753/DUF2309 family)/NADH:ubiquinone oxidoreductase subunit 5 (subunit L)/multisubunit Na+/H+ antiporter MnhA subunit